MSLHLWIMRHGEAHRQAPSDSERELTGQGMRDAARAGEWLARQPQVPQRLFASPYRRAQQTAEQVRRSLPSLAIETVDWLVPEQHPMMTVKHLSALVGPVLLVSHQPLVSALVGVLEGALDAGEIDGGTPLATAELAELDVPMVAVGFATLLSLRSPSAYDVNTL